MSIPDSNAESTAHLIDSEPILILGCSNGEIITLTLLGFFSGLAIGILLALIFGHPLVVVPFPVIGAFVGVVNGGRKLGKMKEGKPNGYYTRYGKLALSKLLGKYIKNNSFVYRSGSWRTRR